MLNLAISEINHANYNPRKIDDESFKGLCESLKKFGMPQPLVVNKKNNILISGHQRLKAAKLLDWKEVPVVYVDLNKSEEKALNVTLNNKLIEGDFDDGLQEILKEIESDLGSEYLNDLRLDELLIEDDISDSNGAEDNVPEIEQNELGVELGDIYQLGEHRLMCGDSTCEKTVSMLMDGEKADMVFTDPPYGINEETDRAFASRTRKAKGNTFKKIIGDDSIETALKAFDICNSLSDIIVYWGGNYYAHKLHPSPCWLVWDKRCEEKQRDMNSDCELAYIKHPKKESVRIFRHLWKEMIKGSEHGKKRVHPTQKPIALAEWSFLELNPKGKTVLDLFLGSGSTLIACEKTNRKCFGMELDPHYCSVIIKRWQDYSGQTAVKVKN